MFNRLLKFFYQRISVKNLLVYLVYLVLLIGNVDLLQIMLPINAILFLLSFGSTVDELQVQFMRALYVQCVVNDFGISQNFGSLKHLLDTYGFLVSQDLSPFLLYYLIFILVLVDLCRKMSGADYGLLNIKAFDK